VEPSWLTKIIQCCLYKLFRDWWRKWEKGDPIPLLP
jgi:hypothetical protein